MKLNKKTGGGLLGFALIAIALFVLLGGPSALGLRSTVGVQIGSLSNAYISGACSGCAISQSNFTGPYWFASLFLSGPFQPFVSSSSSIAQQLSNSSVTGGAQTDAISISANNRIIYVANGNAGSTVLNTYQLATYTGQFSYTECNSQIPIVSGNANTRVGGCVLAPTADTNAVKSYIAACETAVKSAGGNDTNGVAIDTSGTSSSFECYALQRQKYGQVFQLNQGQPDYTIAITLNGRTITLSPSKTQAYLYNQSGKVYFGGYVNPTQAGGTFFGPPTPQSIGALFVNSSAGVSKLIQYYSLANIQNAQVQVNSTVLNITGGSNHISLAQAINQLAIANNKLAQTAFQSPTASTAGLSVPMKNQSGNSYFVILNDTGYNYIRPYITIVSSAAFMGFSLTAASCSISTSPISFVSGSTGTEAVTVQNTGSQGTCIVNASSVPQGFRVSGSQTTSILNQGASQTLTFQIFGLAQNSGSTQTSAITFEACNGLNQNCKTSTASLTYAPACTGGSVLVNGNCQPITPINPPTTTIPQGGTSTVPASVVCNPPAVFNQTLFNEHVSPPCSVPPTPSNLWEYIVAAVVIIVVAGALLGSKRKKRGTR